MVSPMSDPPVDQPIRQRVTLTFDQEFSGAGFRSMEHFMEPLPLPAPPILRLHNPDAPTEPAIESPPPPSSPADAGDPRRLLSLPEYYEQAVLPGLVADNRASATLTDHRTAMGHWNAVFADWQTTGQAEKPPDVQENHRTIGPVVFQCGEHDVLEYYVQQLRLPVEEGGRGVGYHSARKYLSWVKLTLKHAKQRKLVGDVPDVPIPNPPGYKKPRQVVVSDVGKLIRAAWRVAQWPKIGRLEPGFVWETWFLLFWVYGARTQDFCPYKSGKLDGLCWSGVTFDPPCPEETLLGDDGNVLQAPHGWLRYQPEKTKHSKGEELVLPLHSEVAKRLRRFVGLHATRVFPYGRTKGNRQTGVVGFVTTFDAIVTAAGLGADVTIAGTGPTKRSIRKGCTNNWDVLQDGLGEWILGHARQGVHKGHYKDATRRIVQLIEQLKMPSIEHLPLFD